MEIKDYNIIIGGWDFYDQPVRNGINVKHPKD